METDKDMTEMRLGWPVICQKCGEKSFHPFYACKGDCPLSIRTVEKDQIHSRFEPSHVTCHELRKPCGNKRIKRSDLLNHLKNSHHVKAVTLYPPLYPEKGIDKDSNLGTMHIALPAVKLLENEEFRWPTTTFILDGLEFMFGAVLDPKDKRGSRVHFWVFFNGAEKVAKKFRYSVAISSSLLTKLEKKKLNWARVVHSWSYYDFNMIRSRRETAPVPVKCLTPICKKQEGKQDQKYFNLEIKMFKSKDGIPTP